MRRRWRRLSPVDRMAVVVTALTVGLIIALLIVIRYNGE